jgi:hypothetical protein
MDDFFYYHSCIHFDVTCMFLYGCHEINVKQINLVFTLPYFHPFILIIQVKIFSFFSNEVQKYIRGQLNEKNRIYNL